MCYIVFISYSLHWRYIKIALGKYVINIFTSWLNLPNLDEWTGQKNNIKQKWTNFEKLLDVTVLQLKNVSEFMKESSLN